MDGAGWHRGCSRPGLTSLAVAEVRAGLAVPMSAGVLHCVLPTNALHVRHPEVDFILSEVRSIGFQRCFLLISYCASGCIRSEGI